MKNESTDQNNVEGAPEGASYSMKGLPTDNEALLEPGASRQDECASLRRQIEELEKQLSECASQRDALQQQIAEINAQYMSYASHYLEVEQQNANLAMLYTSCHRLHSTLDRQEVLSIIQEIVINLVGSEEMAIFEASEEGEFLHILDYFGLDPSLYDIIPVGVGVIGRTALSDHIYLAQEQRDDETLPYEEDITACIPLRVDGRSIGLIAVFRLLDQKPGVEEIDKEVFNLLATHAATALYCTSLRDKENIKLGV